MNVIYISEQVFSFFLISTGVFFCEVGSEIVIQGKVVVCILQKGLRRKVDVLGADSVVILGR